MPCLEFTVPGVPIGKPRMTQRDKWMKRPCVMRYRAWADDLRKAAMASGGMPEDPYRLRAFLYFPMPASWSVRQEAEMANKQHRVKPDASNVLKAIEDALVPNDQKLCHVEALKFWTLGQPYSQITVWGK